MISENDRKAVMDAVAKVQAHYFRRIGNTRTRATALRTEDGRETRQGFDMAKKTESGSDSLGSS